MNILIAKNAVTAKLLSEDKKLRTYVSEILSYYEKNYQYTQSYITGGWDGRSTFFNWRTNTFPAGFVSAVVKKLRNAGYNVQIVAHPLPPPLGPIVTPDNPLVDNFPPDPRYEFQFRTVDLLLRYGSMIAQIATGGGKSRIARLAIKRIGRLTLFLTTRQTLMYQMGRQLEESGFDVGYIGDGEWSIGKDVTVAMVQSIMAKMNRNFSFEKKILRILESFEFVIGEEAHESGAEGYFSILRFCKNAHYRLALTATPFMRDDAEANMRLMASFGPIGIRVSEKHLIDCGILARPIFKFIYLQKKPPKLFKTTAWPRCYELGIIENEFRNKAILYEVLRAAQHNLSVLILVQRKRHGTILKKMLSDAGLRTEYIFGETNSDIRSDALRRLSSGKTQVLIGSTILDVGVDVPAIGMIIIAGGGKAEVGQRQRIGRGLRAKKNGKNVCYIVDFIDPHNKILLKHSIERKRIIETTPGFVENILPASRDFEFN